VGVSGLCIDVAQIPTEHITRQMVKQMTIPTKEEQLLLKQHLQLFKVIFEKNKVIIYNDTFYTEKKWYDYRTKEDLVLATKLKNGFVVAAKP
jgi:hypothetical protein